MTEIVSIFFPKPMKISKRFLKLEDLAKQKEKLRDSLWVQGDGTLDFLIFKQKMFISFTEESEKQAINTIQRIIQDEKGVGIKIYSKETKKKLLNLLNISDCNIL